MDKEYIDRMHKDNIILLTRIDTNLKNLIDDYQRHEKEDKERFEAHNKRISWVEKLCWITIGGVAIIKIFFKL